MAEAGLQVINTSGALQIDSTFKNPVRYSSGQVTPTTNFVTATLRQANIVTNRPVSFCALESVGGAWATVLNYKDTNGNVVHKILTYGVATVNYWLFTDQVPASSNFGLEVYNASGERVFQGTEAYMNILDVIPNVELTERDDLAVQYTLPVPSGNHIVAPTSRPLAVRTAALPVPPGTIIYSYVRFIVLYRTNATSVDVAVTTFDSGSVPGGAERIAPAYALVMNKLRLG